MPQVVTDPKSPRFGLPVEDDGLDTDPKSPTFGLKKAATGINQWGEAWQAAKDLVSGTLDMVSAVGDPMKAAELGRGLIQAQVSQYQKGQQAKNEGRPLAAIGHTLASVVPVVGPMVAAPVEDLASGHYGRAAVNIGAAIAPSLAGKLKIPVLPRMVNANPVAAAAVEFGLREGIPVDAATATGNPALRAAQHLNEHTLGGSLAAKGSRQAFTTAMEDTGRRLANKVNAAGPMSAEMAGENALGGVDLARETAHAEANAAYGKLRQMEQASAVPVDLIGVKSALKPIYDKLVQERKFADLNPDKAKAAVALETLLNSPDAAPLSVVDSALSDLKGIARGADLPELRSRAQGTAAFAVRQLDAAVKAAATKAGPEVVNALEQGRMATRAKYVAADVRKALVGNGMNPEPVRIFNKLIASDDTSINLLRRLKTQSPSSVQNIGRALVDQLVGELTEKGTVAKARSIQNRWNDLGAETKAELIPDAAHRADLNNFFELAVRASENPNPSGSAHHLMQLGQAGLMFSEPLSGIGVQIGAAGLAKLLHSPVTTRLLLRGLKAPVNARAVATSILPGLLKAAGADAVPLGLPAFAQQAPQPPSIK